MTLISVGAGLLFLFSWRGIHPNGDRPDTDERGSRDARWRDPLGARSCPSFMIILAIPRE